YKFDNKVKLTIAPGVMFFNAARFAPGAQVNENQFSDVGATAVLNHSSGDVVESGGASHLSYIGETRHEVILLAPGDVTFKLCNLPTKFYWDFAYNTQGAARSEEIYKILYPDSDPAKAPISKHNAEDDVAWLVGVKVGDNKKKGNVSLNVNWRETGITSVDPNLNDSDFALGELNTRGLKTELTYNITDFATLGVSYFYAWNLRDEFSGGAATAASTAATSGIGGATSVSGAFSGKGVADANNVQVLFVDLVVKF
ncbi:MAG: hypothetical protein QOD99_18, partial [Chthoniobacter sp.]|nr:hypothetical protein [Chthoniobacter sp.]